jgi:hypothetical protein
VVDRVATISLPCSPSLYRIRVALHGADHAT